MEVQYEIAERMERIRAIFQYIISVPLQEGCIHLSEAELNATETEFRSVAFEATAMRLALKDISTDNTFNYWHAFMKGIGAKHLTQVHIGLGWAMAQQQLPVLPYLETIEPLMQYRVADGYGYYEGIFRKRKTIEEKLLPSELENKFLHGYDQGIGRSIWYSCKADCKKTGEIAARFPYTRQKDIWRGIGTACAYVGGYDENLLAQLSAIALEHSTQLAIGAALVSRTRIEAGSDTRYSDMACRQWCKCSGEEAFHITMITEPLNAGKEQDPYTAWITAIEEAFIA